MGESQLLNGIVDSLMDTEVSASRTPGRELFGTDVKDS